MNIESVLENLDSIFKENGILVDDYEAMLIDYIPDSITFVSMIISIEETFDIELPDEILLIENLGTTMNLAQRILELVGNL